MNTIDNLASPVSPCWQVFRRLITLESSIASCFRCREARVFAPEFCCCLWYEVFDFVADEGEKGGIFKGVEGMLEIL